jgi:hypothetical protein
MKRTKFSVSIFSLLAFVALASGCASTGEKNVRAKSTDGRSVQIGRPTPAPGGGTNFANPHLEKCWVADGFNFTGYDVLYIAPTHSAAKFPDKPEDAKVHEMAMESLRTELAREIRSRNIFPAVVTHEANIKPNARVLRMENTITEFSKGGGAARYFAGLYGAGQPVLRVEGKMLSGNQPKFTYEARRSGVSAGARMGGVFMRDDEIQVQDIRSMTLDLADFMAVLAGKYARQ